MARADMESASSTRQSLQAAGDVLPEGLSASIDVGLARIAMMGDQSLCKTLTVKGKDIFSAKRFWVQLATA
jgi:hypothetical protein